MQALRRQKLMFILMGVCTLSLVVFLVLYALKQNINLFYTPGELASHPPHQGQWVRVGGMVARHSVHRMADSLIIEFIITDDKASLHVRYEGVLPTLFREGQGVVVKGRLQSDGLFNAQEVLAKHDENYMPPQMKQAIAEGAFHDG